MNNNHCINYSHRGYPKIVDGKIWSFFENDEKQELIQDGKLHGIKVKVASHMIIKAMLLDVQSCEIDSEKIEWCKKCGAMGTKH